ncbi:hypothetical protein DH2020_037533 [Rehmannia glutinosa]|uniref:Pentatricopeptide repeat-containing protein n=1 Tax=Rehmannia glutinosa TaxID=99300 RepID=A0ABR0V3W7_REHGL
MRSKCYREVKIAIPENPIQELIKLNCLLKNLLHAGHFSDALHLFQQIHSSHQIKPDHYTLSTAITACANLQETRVGAQLHAHSIQSGLKIFPHVTNTLLSLYAKSRDLVSVKRVFDEIVAPDVYSHTTLLSACTKLGEVDYARHVFDQMPERNVAVWNAMITGCAENGHDWIAFDFFHKMHVLGVKGDNYTFASVLSLCSLEQFDFGRQLHSVVVKTGFLRRVSVINSLLTMYFNCKRATDAYGVFEEVGCEVGDEITYNAIIAGLVSMERDEEALLMFKDMKTVGLKPTELTFVSVMGACFFLVIASQVHGQAIKMKFEDCTSVSNAAISMYSNCGDINSAYLVFRRLEKKDVVSWNAIIASYAEENLNKEAMLAYIQMQRNDIEPDEFTIGSLNGEIEQASKLFYDMHSKNLISWNSMISGFLINGLHTHALQHFSKLLLLGLRPNHYTLSLVLSICASISDLQHGKQVHAYILKFGYFFHTLLGNALIALYSKCGALTWRRQKAIDWFEAMQCSGAATPDNATFTVVLSACSRSGLVADGIQIFNLMVNGYGIEPEANHFSCIIDLLGRAGFLDIAERLIKNRGFDIDSGVWWTLFSLCAAHGHIQLGTIIAEFLLETGKEDPAVYVHLSNLYANAGKWEDAANLRELMKKYGVMKQPGSSWITS